MCPDCHGKGLVEAPAGTANLPGPSPCPECGGAGLVHCCEGLQAQPGEGPTCPTPDGPTAAAGHQARPPSVPPRVRDHVQDCGKRHQAAEEEGQHPEDARRPPGPLGDAEGGEHQAG